MALEGRAASQQASAQLAEILRRCKEGGIHLDVSGHDLRAVCARGRIPAEIAAQLREYKQNIVRFLSSVGHPGLKLPAIEVGRPRASFPLSYAQRRLWFLSQYIGASPVYNVPLALRLSETVNVEALSRALQTITERHETLRTRFEAREGEAVQIIDAPSWQVAVEPIASRAEVLRISQSERSYPFDLAAGGLCRIRLLQDLEDGGFVLLVTMHHIVSDGWSTGVFLRELTKLYAAFSRGQPSPLEPLPIQYADFATWQRSWMSGEVLQEQLAYWRRQLADLPPLLSLPTDRPRPAQQTYRGAAISVALPLELSRQLAELSQQYDVTLFMTLLAAFGVLLGRYAGQNDVPIGTPIANRTRRETEGLIGFFVNTLVMRIDMRADPTFAELLRQTREMALQAYAHQDVPFEQLVEELNPHRSLSHSPLFQVMFGLQHLRAADVGIDHSESLPLDRRGLARATDSSTAHGVSRFDLSLTLSESSFGLRSTIEYNSDLFDRETVEAFAGHYQNLLRSAADTPTARISRLDLLDEAGRQRQLIQWNDSARTYGPVGSVDELFERQARRTPDAVAIVFHDARMTYADLNARKNRLARYLKAHGVRTDVLVGLCIERSVEAVVAILAILKAGGAYVPLDPLYPEQRLRHMIDEAAPCLVLTSARHARLFASADRVLALDSQWAEIATYSDGDFAANDPDRAHERLAYVMYTSGSTGKPKAVCVTQRGLCNLLQWYTSELELTESDRILVVSSIAFDLTQKNVLGCLLVGGQVHLAPEPFDPQSIVTCVEEGAITTLNLASSAFYPIVDVGVRENALSSLRQVILGAEVLQVGRISPLLKLHPGLRFMNSYGPCECSDMSTIYRMPRESVLAQASAPIGTPIANTQVYLLDSGLQPVPVGATGEIYLAGHGVARGYLQDARLSAIRFLPHPFSSVAGARMYRSGDLGRWRGDGNIEFVGRVDRQVKFHGFRIELTEIENVLLEAEGAREAVVLLRDDESVGARLIAYVVLESIEQQHSGTEVIERLRSHCRKRLAAYMVPQRFVLVHAFPLTRNGKVDRDALPAPDQSTRMDDYTAPKSVTERLLAELWCGVLGVDHVSRDDNFFALGGHSLAATRLLSRIRDAFSAELSLRTLFEHQSLRAQASEIDACRNSSVREPAPIERVSRGQPLLASYAQRRLWFLSQYIGASPVYNVPLALRLSETVNVEALSRALQTITERHETLRTRFEAREGEAVQIIDAPSWQVAVEPIASRAEVLRISQSERSYPFDLAAGGLCRIRLLQDLEDGGFVLLVTMHHIVSDGWSTGVFLRELTKLYAAFSRGQPSPLEPLPIQYADFATWQRSWMSGEVLQEQLAYWRRQLADLPPLLSLPTDRPRPAQQTYRGAAISVALPLELSRQLAELSQQYDVTLFMTLLAAFGVLLGRYAGQNDVPIGTPIANRTRRETEGLIGFFVNTLVMRIDMRADPTFAELLRQTREMALQAYAHQDVPFEQLVEELNPHRSLSHSPLFQVMFGLQHLRAADVGIDHSESLPLDRRGLARATDSSTAHGVSRFDLSVTVSETARGVDLAVEYNIDLFDRSTVERMLEHYMRLLAAVATVPKKPVNRVEFLSPDELELLGAWSAKPEREAAGSCAYLWLEQHAETRPDAIAFTRGERLSSYRDINRRANQLAHYLIEQHVGRDVAVGLCVNDGIDAVVALFAILKAGGVCVLLDAPCLEHFSHVLRDSGVRVVVGDARLAERVRGSVESAIGLDEGEVRHLLESQCADNPAPNGGHFADARACVLYVPGERSSVGVVIPHSELAAQAARGGEDADLDGAADLVTIHRELLASYGSTGQRRFPGRRAYVLSSELLPQPTGVFGELCVGGAPISHGCLGHPADTAERFVPNPFGRVSGERLYRTGNRARWLSTGQLDQLGRVDSQAHFQGYRLEPERICQVLLCHPDVEDVVVSVADRRQGVPELIAHVVRLAGSTNSGTDAAGATTFVDDLLSHARANLPSYWVPHAVMIQRSLPRGADGRVDVDALPRGEWTLRSDLPSTIESQTALRDIWQTVLRVRSIDLDDNFFALGGDSVLSIQVVIRARERGLLLKVRQLFEHQSIRELARHVQPLESRVDELPCSGRLQLLPIQRWFWSGAVPRPAHFHQSVLLTVPRNFSLEFLQTFVEAIHLRHDVLRVRYVPENRNCRAQFEPLSEKMLGACCVHVELKGMSPLARADELRRRGELVKTGFDLREGPLFRAVYFEADHREDSRLLLVVHHLAMDGVSLRILLGDLAYSFEQWSAGRLVRLAAKTTSYQQWSNMLHEYAKSAVLKSERRYWIDQLSGLPQVLPTDRTAVGDDDWSGCVPVRLNREETEALLSRSNAAYHTDVRELMLAAVALAVYRWSGARRVGLWLESHGREDLFDDVDLSETLGWFTSVHPLNLSIEPEYHGREPWLRELITGVKERIRAVPHHGLGFGVLRYLAGDGELARLEDERHGLLLFNYMGQFDQQLGEQEAFRPAPENTGDDGAGNRKRDHALELDGVVIGHRLEFRFRYSVSGPYAGTVERLGELYRAALCEIIEHCGHTSLGTYTPADFPLAGVDQQTLDSVQGGLLGDDESESVVHETAVVGVSEATTADVPSASGIGRR